MNKQIAEAANDDGSSKARKKLLSTRVTFLEMNHPGKRHYPLPSRPRLALIRAENIGPAFYRFLYEQVGKPHHWYERRRMDDVELDNAINSETTEIQVLYADGCPAGFFELDLGRAPDDVELVYFGLIPDYQGLQLGKWFLNTAVASAWKHEPSKVSVQTNSLDHAAALPIYQKIGFSPVGYMDDTVEAWT